MYSVGGNKIVQYGWDMRRTEIGHPKKNPFHSKNVGEF